MSVFWSTVFTWSNEAALFLLFGWGVLVLASAVVRRRRWSFPQVTDRALVRFCVWQVFVIAAWSALFKDLLPAFVRQPSGPLYHGWSQTFATSAQDLGCVLALLALWSILVRVFERKGSTNEQVGQVKTGCVDRPSVTEHQVTSR